VIKTQLFGLDAVRNQQTPTW